MKNTFSVGESFHEEKYDVFNEEPEEDYRLGKQLQIIWWQGFPIILLHLYLSSWKEILTINSIISKSFTIYVQGVPQKNTAVAFWLWKIYSTYCVYLFWLYILGDTEDSKLFRKFLNTWDNYFNNKQGNTSNVKKKQNVKSKRSKKWKLLKENH